VNKLQITLGKEIQQGEKTFTQLIGGFGEDKPVITVRQITKLLDSKDKVVNQTINRNIDSFEEGIHVLDLKNSVTESDPLLEVLKTQGYTRQSMSNSKNIYIFSQAGFLLFLKFAEGDKAVEIYKNFIEDYFKTKAENKNMKLSIEEEIQQLKEDKNHY